ncbi:hypothetical protein A6R68_00303 [Neotoma lepida]|uniref:Uncharacterized protein n=1 Tax=Neotoma lepida TaxID=56216 RepID=A0A1A6GYW5_NEOLE|nr:hypothetical protein A6R68_00303 [Neotoma lepida]
MRNVSMFVPVNVVMLAASYWSLLAPAVEMATSSGGFGAFAFFPVAVGFTLGAAFVYLADLLMPHLVSIVFLWAVGQEPSGSGQ